MVVVISTCYTHATSSPIDESDDIWDGNRTIKYVPLGDPIVGSRKYILDNFIADSVGIDSFLKLKNTNNKFNLECLDYQYDDNGTKKSIWIVARPIVG